ncbi:MAG: tetratricopeptide repeat protein [Mogibacterium sp.]|nr:tetratricopeptide repeat protein [Mogibacterium sp.]
MIHLKRALPALLVIALVFTAACSSSPKYTLEQAQAYLSEGNYEEAIEAYTALIEITPDSPDLFMGRANAYAHTARYTEATADYTSVIDLDNTIVDAHAYRGVMYSILDEPELAKTDFSDAVELTSEEDRAAAFDLIYDYLEELDLPEENGEENEAYTVRVFQLPNGEYLVIFQFADDTIGVQIIPEGEAIPSFAMDNAIFSFAWYSPDFGWFDTGSGSYYEGPVTIELNGDTVTAHHSGGTSTAPSYYQGGGIYAGDYLVGGSGSIEDPATAIYIMPPGVYDGQYGIIVGEVHAGYSGLFTPVVRE